MKTGQHYTSNLKKLSSVTDEQWACALAKCRRHVKFRIKQKTLFGAHTEKNLGEDPFHYYTAYAYEAIISGVWEWQDRFNLAEQLIRIINSRITAEVEKTKTEKAGEFTIIYKDIETELYTVGTEINDLSEEDLTKFVQQVETVEKAIKGDENLEFFWEGVKEGKKRAELALLMDMKPKQLDKLKEKFIRVVRNNGSEKQ